MAEGAIVRSIMEWLRKQPDCQAMKVHGSVYVSNEPDIVGCCAGRMFAFEVKRPGQLPRPAQEARLRQWAKAGAVVAAPTSLQEVQQVIFAIRRMAVSGRPAVTAEGLRVV